jgi:hypothetical protein
MTPSDLHAPVNGQDSIFAALDLPEPAPLPTPTPTPRRVTGPRWTPAGKAATCTDCFAAQHQAALAGAAIPRRYRAAWQLVDGDTVTALCTGHATERGHASTPRRTRGGTR